MRALDARSGAQVRMAAIVGALAGLSLLLGGILFPSGALQGWLIAFVVLTGLSFGALALLCIGRLTGGKWQTPAAPALRLAAAASPIWVIAFVPILIGTSFIFPWSVDPAVVNPDVASLYLHPAFFALRGVASLLTFAWLAYAVLRRGRGRLSAALGLVLYAVAIDFLAVDWMLSLAPRFSSSAFGADIAIQQILASLALVLVLAPKGSDSGDLAGLTLAAALGTLYMELMSLIVNWYGNQPERAAWYLERIVDGWLWVAIIALACSALIPIAALMFETVRSDAGLLRFVGATILVGIVAHDVWLMAPSCDWRALPSAFLALVALGGISFAFANWWLGRIDEGRALHAG